MKILLINNHTKFLDEIISFLPGEVTVCDKDKLDNIEEFKNYNLVVFSGGSNVPTVMRHPDLYLKEISIIKNTNLPILGICMGAELISVAFGGTLKDLVNKLDGEYNINIIENQARNIIGDIVKVFEGHSVGIDYLPKCLEVIASSDNCIEIFKHREKAILGLQFHPEIDTNVNLKNWIFNSLIKNNKYNA